MRDIVTAIISTEADMSVVGFCDDKSDVLAETRRTGANIVMFELLSEDLAPPYVDLMYAKPRTRVVGLRVDGGSAQCYELRPSRHEVLDVSSNGLLELIRRCGDSRVDVLEPDPAS
jgi:hypothetical protein